MPRYRRHRPYPGWGFLPRTTYKRAEVARITPRCPTCGHERARRAVGAYRHGRAVVGPYRRWGDTPGPSARPIRIPKRKVVRGWRNTALCSDPFHTAPPRPREDGAPPRGRQGHHPDLRKAKARLSRALQGKARR